MCVFILFTLFSYFQAQRGQQMEEQSFETSCDSFEAEFSQQLDGFQSIADNLIYYQDITPFDLHGNYTLARRVIRTLHSSILSNPALSSLSVYFFQDTYAYSHQHSLRISELEKNWGLDFSPDGPLAQSLSENNGRPIYLPFLQCSGLSGDQLLIIYPFRYNYEIRGLILMSIPMKELDLLLGNQEGDGVQTFLFSNGELISTQTPPGDHYFAEIPELISQLPESGLRWENSQVRLRAGEAAPGLVYVRTERKSNSFSRLLWNPAAYVLFSLLTAAVIVLATLLLARRSYRPIRELQESLEENQSFSGGPDELQTIFSKFSTLEEKNRQLEDTIRKKFAAEQDYILRCILDGTADEYDDFSGRALDLGIDMNAAYHLLVLLRPSDQDPTRLLRPLQEYAHGEIYHIQIRADSIYLIGLDRRPPDRVLKPIRESRGVRLSAVTESLSDLHREYMALQITQGDRGAFPFPSRDTIPQYTQKMQEIADSLDAQDPAALAEALKPAHELFSSDILPLEAQRYICFHILYIFRNYAELHLSGEPQFQPDRALSQTSTSGLASLLAEESSRMQGLLASQKEQESKPLLSVDHVLDYIRDHYTEPDFSLQKTAVAFGVSQSYLSTFFRDNYSMKLLDYCTILRMEKAKELLQNTTLTLEKIAEQIGYFNTSSFIRRFKQLYNLTPGEYKQLKAKQG